MYLAANRHPLLIVWFHFAVISVNILFTACKEPNYLRPHRTLVPRQHAPDKLKLQLIVFTVTVKQIVKLIGQLAHLGENGIVFSY